MAADFPHGPPRRLRVPPPPYGEGDGPEIGPFPESRAHSLLPHEPHAPHHGRDWVHCTTDSPFQRAVAISRKLSEEIDWLENTVLTASTLRFIRI